MKHSIKISGSHVSITLTGKIYAHDAGIIRDEVLELIDNGTTDISIDLSELEYIDSSGLGVLVTVHKRMMEKNGRLVLNNVWGIVSELLKRTRLDRVLIIE